MKELYLVRHAKSDWGNEVLQDIDRPISKRGYDDAYFMASGFKKKRKLPDLLVSSTASRALNTCLIFARCFGMPEDEILLKRGIYESGVKNLAGIFSGLPNHLNTAMAFGHNPGFTDFINEFSDHNLENLPTCGIVLLTYDTDSWTYITKQTAHFSFSEFPKDFRA